MNVDLSNGLGDRSDTTVKNLVISLSHNPMVLGLIR